MTIRLAHSSPSSALAAARLRRDRLDGGGLGDKGKPVTLTVGYQPYYAESWSGLVLRDKKFYEKYLPKGSKVNFQVGLQGSVHRQPAAGRQAGRSATWATCRRSSAPASARRATCGSSARSASPATSARVFLARNDAPDFADQQEAIKWMDGKTVATPQGSCTDRIAQATFKQEGVKPKEYLNQPLDVISSNFESGKIDAAIVWEPTASRLVNAGLAKRVGQRQPARHARRRLPRDVDKELLDDRPDVAEGWLKAELDAQRFLADPANADEIAAIAKQQTQGFRSRTCGTRCTRRGRPTRAAPSDGVRIRLPFVVTPDARAHIAEAAAS